MSAKPNSQIICREFSDAELSVWDEFVFASPTGSPYACSSYLGILAELLNNRRRIIGVWNHGRLVAGIGYLEAPSKFGTVVLNRLLLHYNGIVISAADSLRPDSASSAISELLHYLSQRKYLACTLHSRAALPSLTIRPDLHWQTERSRTYEVNLQQYDTNNLSKNFRRLLRKAEEHELTFITTDDIDSCFQLHAETLNRKGADSYLPEPTFRKYVEGVLSLKLGSLSFATTKQGEKVAMQLVLHNKHPMTHTILAGAKMEWNRIGASVFLRARSFEYLRKLGYEQNDLTGAANLDVARFKAEIGGEERLTWVHRQPESPRSRLVNTLTKTTKTLTKTLMRVRERISHR